MSAPSLSRIAAVILLFVALIHLPIGYYTFLRIAITCIAVYNAYEVRHDANKLWMIFFIVAAIVFNPIIPIYLRHKSEWMPVDIIFGVVFLTSVIANKNNSHS
jgi:hypothetical protein